MAYVSVPSLPDKYRVEELHDYVYGSAQDVCECGYKYAEHVTVPGYRWLRRLCDGTLVKIS